MTGAGGTGAEEIEAGGTGAGGTGTGGTGAGGTRAGETRAGETRAGETRAGGTCVIVVLESLNLSLILCVRGSIDVVYDSILVNLIQKNSFFWCKVHEITLTLSKLNTFNLFFMKKNISL